MRFIKVLILFFLFLQTGCASYFARKTCEKTNWYQHGYNIAMSGNRITADSYFKNCEKVESLINYADLDIGFKKGMGNYCKPKTVFNTGKSGQSFKEDLCDGSILKRLQVKYNAGLKIFCKPSNAKIFGAKGGVYENVCPEEREAKFLTQYRRGRSIFLDGLIGDKQKEISNISIKTQRNRQDRQRKSRTLANLAGRKVLVQRNVKNRSTGKYEKKSVWEDDSRTKSKRSSLESEIRNIDRKLNQMENKKDGLQKQVQDHRQELRALRVEEV